jgi:hypothetical protein
MSSDDNNGSLFDRVKRNSSIRLSGPAPSAEPEVSKILQGDLADKNISWLLMAAQQVEATGALVIGSGACNVTVQFGLGKAVHAWSPFATGDEVIMDYLPGVTARCALRLVGNLMASVFRKVLKTL